MQAVLRPSNRLLQILPAAELQSLLPHLETVDLAKGAVLTEAGAPIPSVYLPHSGVISMMVSLSEGQTVEVAMVGRDSLVGGATAFDDGPALTEATVVVPGTASILKAEDLRAAADRSGILRGLLSRHEQALLAQAQQSAACNASHSADRIDDHRVSHERKNFRVTRAVTVSKGTRQLQTFFLSMRHVRLLACARMV